jgi:hypothetical protein
MIYSLKDAAESDGLSGTTFIQMNYMVAIWALFGELGTDGLCGGTKESASHIHQLTSNLLSVFFFRQSVSVRQSFLLAFPFIGLK